MRLGIDFGTTRVVVAAVDRGNYPVVSFESPDGATNDWFPPLVAANDTQRLYGWDAWAKQDESGWTITRSLKRLLEDAGPRSRIVLGRQTMPMQDLLREMVTTLKRDLFEGSSLQLKPGEPLQVLLGVPANANSNQRFLTMEAFRLAGFEVLGLLNEPSAASIEFGHRQRLAGSATAQKGSILVYDLGGGTFDVSLVELNDRTHSVRATEGIPTLGGDDFDMSLAEFALETAGISAEERDQLTQAEVFRLNEECRLRKEALHPNTRRITIDLETAHEGWGTVSVSCGDYYDRCRPLVEETLNATKDLLVAFGYNEDGSSNSESPDQPKLETVYVTGGGSELPLVSRVLREQFGRRVKRSAHTRAATAIGLAIQADEQAGYILRERFSRYFGVWREAEGGKNIIFDPLFPKGTALPAAGEGPIINRRAYCPVHNVGHFRYLECSQRTEDGQPRGEITLWDEVLFPFDPGLQDQQELTAVPVAHTSPTDRQMVHETYSCDSSGAVLVTITNESAGYSRRYRLGRWSGKDAPIAPGRKKRPSKKEKAATN